MGTEYGTTAVIAVESTTTINTTTETTAVQSTTTTKNTTTTAAEATTTTKKNFSISCSGGVTTVYVGQKITIVPTGCDGNISYTITPRNSSAPSGYSSHTNNNQLEIFATNQGAYDQNDNEQKFKWLDITAHCNGYEDAAISVAVESPYISIGNISSGGNVKLTFSGPANQSANINGAIKKSDWNDYKQLSSNYGISSLSFDDNGHCTITLPVDTDLSSTLFQLWYADKEIQIESAVFESAETTTPTFTLTADKTTITEGQSVTFTPKWGNDTVYASYSVSVKNGSEVTYNTNYVNISGNQITFNQEGTYVVTAVKSDDSTQSDTVEITVNESSGGFSASVSPSTVVNGGTVTITATDTIYQIQGINGGEIVINGNVATIVIPDIYSCLEGEHTISIVHSYYPLTECTVTIQVVAPTPTPAPSSYLYAKQSTLTPYYAELPKTEEQPKSKRSTRPLRSGDVMKTVGAEAANSEVTELFFNSNVSDIIEIGAGQTADTGLNVSVIGGKVRLKANKKGAGEEWTKIISDLPATDAAGNPYYYWVEEVYVTEGYSAGYTGNCIKADTVAAGSIPEITIINTRSYAQPALPSSGGEGTRIFYTAGAMLLVLSAAGYTMYKRRRWFMV